MTIIAWDGKTMAGDTLVLEEGAPPNFAVKVFRGPFGSVYGVAAHLRDHAEVKRRACYFAQCVKGDGSYPDFEPQYDWMELDGAFLLAVPLDGGGASIVTYRGRGYPVPVRGRHAIGLERSVYAAMGSMSGGARAVRAVNVASSLTYGQENGVTSFDIGERK